MKHIRFKLFSSLILLVLLGCGSKSSISQIDKKPGTGQEGDGDQKSPEIGKVLPDWQEGYLDIDAINTGRGESMFYILPDGTTMLVDAAGSPISPSNSIPPPPQKPNANVTPGQAIIDFVHHFMPADNQKLNYILLSHFHRDHMGGPSADVSRPDAPEGDFEMSGVTEVGAKVPFDKIVDRGYPDYDYPSTLLEDESPHMANYLKFLEWVTKKKGSKAEQFKVGSNTQFALKNNPSKYQHFEIRNIVGNGRVWSGTGSTSINTFPEDRSEVEAANPNENIFSTGFHLSYGKFDYFSAGDMQYNGKSTDSWKDIETPVSKVLDAVDVLKADHHGTSNTNGEAYVNKLRPQVLVCNVWREVQPNPETIARFFNANDTCKIFLTNLSSTNKGRLGNLAPRLKSFGGHIVVRVLPGGDQYKIYVLDDANESYTVQQVYGPYDSK